MRENRFVILGCLAAASLSACNLDSYSGDTAPAAGAAAAPAGSAAVPQPSGTTGFTSAGTVAGTHDVLLATASAQPVAAVVGANRTVTITFASSDGLSMTGLAVSGAAGGLPAGWSGPGSFTCASVTTGSACVLELQYAPTAVASGTLIVNTVIVDDAGLANTASSVSIPFAATAYDNVVAVAAPSGEIDAAIGGSSAVIVNFATDDGNPATDLAVATNLASLPSGWTSAVPALTCATVGAGNGCELALAYAPTAAGGGTLALTYTYTDDSGAPKVGSLNIPYRAGAANNVVTSAAPAGEVTAALNAGQAVSLTFTTDDGKAASRLRVTSDLSKLPAGWTSGSPAFACATVAAGSGCQLPLRYAPTALGGGTLNLSYAYTDATGTARSGLLAVPYAATTNDNVAATVAPSGQIVATVGAGTQAVAVKFATDDARPASALMLTTPLAGLPAGWSSPQASFGCDALDATTVCSLPLNYTPTAAGAGTLSLAYAYLDNAGAPKTGTVSIAYRATTNDNVVGTIAGNALGVGVGGSAALTVTFATDDANAASLLSLTTDLASLPPGWSGAPNGLSCATVSAGAPCTLSLAFAPTAVAAGTLDLAFAYTNDAGLVKTGTVSIPYSATP